MKKSIVTEYEGICFLCGKPSEAEHHLVFGVGIKQIADKDRLTVPICNNCHNTGEVKRRIHDNPVAEKMSKMIGQLAWEKEYLTQDMVHHNAESEGIGKQDEEKEQAKRDVRKKFIVRYGRSYL